MKADQPLPPPAWPPGAERIWREFRIVLDALPPPARAALLLRALFRASDEDIAALLGEPAPACRAHVARARAQASARLAALRGREDEGGAP